MKIDKFDIELLDFIIDKILESGQETDSNILNKKEQFRNIKFSEIDLEFQRLLSIIDFYQCAKIYKFGYTKTAVINENNKKFKEQGGFLKIYQDELTRLEKEDEKEKLKTKNLELQNENLEFAQTIREKEAKIRDLEFKIKRIELLKQYWWFIGICIGIGVFFKVLWDITIAYIQ